MRVVTPKQMREIDRIAIEKYGIPGTVLMENAGAKVAEETVKLVDSSGRGTVVLVAGKGNNGGDVMVAARHLFNRGFPINVFLLGGLDGLKGDAELNARILTNMGIPINVLHNDKDIETLKGALGRGHVIVEGIFGTGLNRKVEGIYLQAIRAINKSGCTVISVDIPSGIDGEKGHIYGDCIRASVTVTFGLPKSGLLQYPGAEHVGRMIVADISIPEGIAVDFGPDMTLLTGDYISRIIPERKPDAHKGSCGRALIIGGSKGMTGAVVLATLGCLKSGAGLVRAALPGALNYVVENNVTEALSTPLGNGVAFKYDGETRDRLREILSWADAVAIGPGMGVDGDGLKILEFVLTNTAAPLILDADALNCLASDISLLNKASGPVIITPHPGEMARLTGMGIRELQGDRIGVAKNYAKEWNAVIVLKGANSVIAHPKGNIYINISGNSGMATGGTGDVLTGVVTSFAAQGLNRVKAACAAVHIHGRAGDILREKEGPLGLTATALAQHIPTAVKYIEGRECCERYDVRP